MADAAVWSDDAADTAADHALDADIWSDDAADVVSDPAHIVSKRGSSITVNKFNNDAGKGTKSLHS